MSSTSPRARRHEARDRRHPRLGCRPREGVLRGPRVAARRRPRRRRPSGSSSSTPGLGVLDPVRHPASRRPHPASAADLLVVSDIEAAHDELVGDGVDAARSSTTPAAATTASTPSVRAKRPRSANGAPTRRSRSSATRTATSGSCRRSRAGCPAASTRRRPRSAPSAISRARSSGRRPRTASTRSARARPMTNWPEWYAAYMVAEQTGAELPT